MSVASRWVPLGETQELSLDRSLVHRIHIIYSLVIQIVHEPYACFSLWEETKVHGENRCRPGGKKMTLLLIPLVDAVMLINCKTIGRLQRKCRKIHNNNSESYSESLIESVVKTSGARQLFLLRPLPRTKALFSHHESVVHYLGK